MDLKPNEKGPATWVATWMDAPLERGSGANNTAAARQLISGCRADQSHVIVGVNLAIDINMACGCRICDWRYTVLSLWVSPRFANSVRLFSHIFDLPLSWVFCTVLFAPLMPLSGASIQAMSQGAGHYFIWF